MTTAFDNSTLMQELPWSEINIVAETLAAHYFVTIADLLDANSKEWMEIIDGEPGFKTTLYRLKHFLTKRASEEPLLKPFGISCRV